MITIKHTYSTDVTIHFDKNFRMPLSGSMDEIAERAMTEMVKHNFNHADVIRNETWELLMVIERS